MRKEAGGGEESKEAGGGEERESGAEVFSVGQIVEHRRLGYRGVVVGSTKVTSSLSNHSLSLSPTPSLSPTVSMLTPSLGCWPQQAKPTHTLSLSLSHTHTSGRDAEAL
jgi:hypothetical protein